MKTVNVFALVSLCSGLFLGCAQFNAMPDVGRDYNASDVKKLTVGESTEEDVIRIFGKPQNRTAMSDGSVQLMYMFSKAHPSAVNLLGHNPGHYESKTMSINLDSNGKLKDYTQTSQ